MTKRNVTDEDTEVQGLEEECADTIAADTSVITGDEIGHANADQADADEDTVNADDPLAQMTAERDKLKEQLLRALADAENMRRRSEREAASVRKYGHTPFARDLVGALDNLGRAVDSTPEDIDSLDEVIKSLITGIKLSWTELQAVIKKHGIEQVTPKGEKFDYNLHQAMFEVPTEEVPSGTVVEVVQHGYVLHDRLLRPAMVGVSKASTPQKPAGDGKKQD